MLTNLIFMNQIILNLDEIDLSVPSQITQFGECHTYQSPDGSIITTLPTTELPLKSLIPANWNPQFSLDRGHFRKVVEVGKLINDESAGIFVKDPERVFSGTKPEGLWWGGSRSREKPILLEDPLVEEQVFWEASILIKLIRSGIKAEIPQAIIEKDGKKSLVVKAIPHRITNYVEHNGPDQLSIQRKIIEIGLIDVDFMSSSNAFKGADGYIHCIDVNRWEWPGEIDQFRDLLRVKLKEAINFS